MEITKRSEKYYFICPRCGSEWNAYSKECNWVKNSDIYPDENNGNLSLALSFYYACDCPVCNYPLVPDISHGKTNIVGTISPKSVCNDDGGLK